MPFCFVHAADLHLDSPLRGLAARDAAVAQLFAAASRRAFQALVERTLDARAAFLVIAGDVFDGDWRDFSTGLFFAREIGRLGRAGIRTFVVRGNHDAESQVTRRLEPPLGLHLFSARKAETVDLPELGVALHGRSFAEREERDSLVAAYPAPLPGRFNIGLLHSSLDGREGHARYAPTTVPELAARGYDYWALGHVHAFEVVSRQPWIVYPGNLQGRHARETGPKGAVLVTVGDDLRVAEVERLVLDGARWAAPQVEVEGAETLSDVLAAVGAALAAAVEEAQGRPLALRLTLGGRTPLHARLEAERPRLLAEIENAALQLSDAVWLERLVLATRPPERAGGAPAGGLADLAALLDEIGLEDADLRARFDEARRDLLSRLPAAAAEDLDADALLREGRDLLLGRLLGSLP